jgi:hypothetical protein
MQAEETTNTKHIAMAAVLTLLNISITLVFDKTVPIVPAFLWHLLLHCQFHVT